MNGLLILDKPVGMTSHDVVARTRRIVNERSIGHLGTLDPMATGVLPLLLGRYTRLAQFFGRMDKAYTGAIRLGQATTTYDAEGEPVGPHVPVSLDAEELRSHAKHFNGELLQTPPAYSAKKVGGLAAYSLARAGQTVELAPVRIVVHDFTITSVDGDTAEFRATVSAGGYIRSLAHDLGQRLGCGAHLASLRRVAAGPFCVDTALSLEELATLVQSGELERHLPHPRTLLPELPATTADAHTAGRMRNGAMCNLADFSTAPHVKVFASRHELIGIAQRVAGTLFQPTVVIG
ncbi:MAG: tRNA pseudouridine55 synthase [Acidobacteriaceae bacterium]|jgi:tRNA pseudouridine55 synthase|nr:tRNA pseudouridine55 synthase [Acidobacteriaceae bacterium]